MNTHIELNSDFVYLNHSCDPNVVINTSDMNIIAVKDISPQEELTFFYPSTEWEMDQPFECWCGSSQCLKIVKGAKYLSQENRNQYFLNRHILSLLQIRDQSSDGLKHS